MADKRVRGPNFTKEEQMLLCQIAEAYSGIIESRKTDAVKQAEKQQAWRKIRDIFNANTKGVPRTVDNLLSCYRNMKSKVKKDHANSKMVLQDPKEKEALIDAIVENGEDWNAVSSKVNKPAEICESGFLEMQKDIKRKESQYKKAIMGTGGGPPPHLKDDEPLNKLKKIIKPQVDGLYTIYDGDSLLMSQCQENVPEHEKIKPIEYGNVQYENIDEDLETDEKEEDEITFTPVSIQSRVDLLRKKKATALDFTKDMTTPKKKNTNAAFVKLAEQKLQLVLLQQQVTEKELRIKELELEDKIKENKHKDTMREKELLLLDLKINSLK